ncbi:MAG: metallophosphoesterase family protein [Anaerolineales bacterium]|nr:metallophosphoesterase family protein [Anaerolineales bacterium]
MKIAILSDIHGNLVALEAVLADIAHEAPDQMVCLGDVAATGPQPGEVLTRLRELGIPIVQGNTDEWLLNPEPWGGDSDFYRRVCDIDLWNAGLLTAVDRAFLQTFQKTVTLDLGGQSLLCFHGSPRHNKDIIVATIPDTELSSFLDGLAATIFAGGHTHQPFARRYQDKLLLNPGSVGMPYLRVNGQAQTPPWAEYALLTDTNGRFSVDLRQVAVDVTAVHQAAFASGMPHAEWWIKH